MRNWLHLISSYVRSRIRHRWARQRLLQLNQHPSNNHASKHLKFIAGIRTSRTRSRTCRNINWTWMNVRRWCWTHCWKLKMKSIQRWHFDDRAVKASAVHVRWTSVAQTRWRASVASIRIWISHAKSIHCRICMWFAIWCQTWAISIISIHRFSHGCSASEYFLFKFHFIPLIRMFWRRCTWFFLYSQSQREEGRCPIFTGRGWSGPIGWIVRMHIVRLLFDIMPIVLVECGQIFRTGRIDASLSLDHRFTWRCDSRTFE